MKESKVTLQKIIDEEVLLRDYKGLENGDDWIFDFRNILLQPKYLEQLAQQLYARIPYQSFQIGGLESAAIPLITAIALKAHADGKKVNGFYIRKSRKKSGLHRVIEGNLNNDPIILVDDLINSGSSFMKQVVVLAEHKQCVAMILSVVQFRPCSYYNFLQKQNIVLCSLFTLHDFGVRLAGSDAFARTKMHQHRTLWSFHAEKSSHANVFPRSTPVLTQALVLFGSDDGYFYALHKDTGVIHWKIAVGYSTQGKSILSSPVLHDGVVYFGAYDGKVYAVEADTGEVVWINCAADWVGSSPAVIATKNMLVIGLEYSLAAHRGATVALDLTTGEILWEYKMQAFTHASPLYIEESDSIVIGGNEGKLYCLDASTGTLHWSYETEGGQKYVGNAGFSAGDIKLSPAYDVKTDTIAFSSYDGHMYMVQAKNGAYIRRFQTERSPTSVPISIYGKPIFTSTYVVFAALDRHVYCYDKYTGDACWKFETSGRIFASPVQYGESLFIGSNDGAIYELDIQTGVLRSKHFLPDRIVSPVVIEATDAGVRMFVITNGTHVYCLSLVDATKKFQNE